MATVESFALIGGDLRSVYLAGALAADGYTVIAAGLDGGAVPPCVTGCSSPAQALRHADAVILPMPVCTDSVTLNAPLSRRPIPLETVCAALRPGQIVFGGAPSEGVSKRLAEAGFTIYDYMAREELALRNAVPTAEGAVQLALEELPVTLYGSRCLVTGYGRVGRALAELLTAMGAYVTVAARKPSDRALARTRSCRAVSIDGMDTQGFDVIFNTVPALLFPEEVLHVLSPDTLLIDLASRPGGVDFDAAASLQVKTIWALSLPGRVAPKTAGEIVKDTLLNMLKEMI